MCESVVNLLVHELNGKLHQFCPTHPKRLVSIVFLITVISEEQVPGAVTLVSPEGHNGLSRHSEFSSSQLLVCVCDCDFCVRIAGVPPGRVASDSGSPAPPAGFDLPLQSHGNLAGVPDKSSYQHSSLQRASPAKASLPLHRQRKNPNKVNSKHLVVNFLILVNYSKSRRRDLPTVVF